MSRWVRLKLSGTFFSEITLSKQWKASYPWKNTKNPEILVSRNPEYFKSRLYPIEDNLGLWDFYFFNFIQNFSVQFFRKSRNFRQRHDRKMKKIVTSSNSMSVPSIREDQNRLPVQVWNRKFGYPYQKWPICDRQ